MKAIFHNLRAGRHMLAIFLVFLTVFTAGCSLKGALPGPLNPATPTTLVTTQSPTEAAATAMAAITPKATAVINTPLPPTPLPSPTFSPAELADLIKVQDVQVSFLPAGASRDAPYQPCEEDAQGFITCILPRGGYEKLRYAFQTGGSAGELSPEDIQRAMTEAKLAVFVYDPAQQNYTGKSLGRMTIKPGQQGEWYGNLVMSTTNSAFVVQLVLGEKALASSNLYIKQSAYYPTPRLPGASGN